MKGGYLRDRTTFGEIAAAPAREAYRGWSVRQARAAQLATGQDLVPEMRRCAHLYIAAEAEREDSLRAVLHIRQAPAGARRRAALRGVPPEGKQEFESLSVEGQD